MKNMKVSHFFALVLVLATCVTFFSPLQTVFAAGENCAPYATKQCISNISYWYNSCGALQSIYQNCNTTNQLCQNGQCIDKPTPPPAPAISHATTACYQNNIYWYNSQGGLQEMQKSCSDTNSCTIDSCSQNQCSNTLKCDGSTCATNSTDYIQYCGGSTTQNPGTANNSGNTGTNTLNNSMQPGSLVISTFAKKDSDPMQWQKYITATSNDKINFLITVKNISAQPINGVSISIDPNSTIVYAQDTKIDNLVSGGDITTGIALGTIPPKTSIAITFSGTIQAQSTQVYQLNSKVTANNVTYDSDIVAINNTSSAITGTNPQTVWKQCKKYL
jgi:hypothetical protein